MVTVSFNIFLIAFVIVISLVETCASYINVTVSGISSGAAMAVQLHMAYSKEISGCGILAGPPYLCAGNLTGVTKCMQGPVQNISALGILLALESYASAGKIDSLLNIENDSVYIFSGTKDSVTLPSIVKLNEKIYSVLDANIKTNYELPATHGFPTNNFGESCDVLNTENFINNCGFNTAYDVLNHLHGGQLIAPKSNSTTPLVGQMIVFRQANFQNPPPSLSVGDISRKWFIGDTFITKTGYLEVAELNNLIVLFPQVAPTPSFPLNPMGCWDWWGANTPQYAIKIAPQMLSIKQMIETVRLINGAIAASVQQ
ncbi:unnamed protein product [Rotaria sordida]|uniref:Uncharacterized protein n=1 Tax=Rotaria sordida TaxID=392033 RepID=A0A813TCQ1_9BILA|nr:unnamed protein product [Rotaria sordida]CAF3670709.1 unnamed protein product [Rotaria sordida]